MEFIKNHFEKILLSIFLVALMGVAVVLVIRIGLLKSALDLDIKKGKSVKQLDEAALGEVERKAQVPPRWAQPKRLFTPPVLVWLTQPGTGLPMLGALGDVIPTSVDEEIPDGEWIKVNGLQNVPGMARQDPDNDGFTNKEEYDYKTNPKDAESFPPVAAYLMLDRLERKEFQLRFKGYYKREDGSRNFQVNVRALDATYFNNLGEQIGDDRKKEPYKIEKFEQLEEEYFDSSLNANRKREVSRLTLRRLDDNSEVVLVLNQITIEKTLGASLRNKLPKPGEQPVFSVNKHQEFSAHGKTYKVVDITEDAVLISDTQSQQQFTLKKAR